MTGKKTHQKPRPTVGELLAEARARLRVSGSQSAGLDARLLVGHVLGLDGTGLVSGEHDPVSRAEADRARALVTRRTTGEPVARILGVAWFYGLEFELGPETLVPRPETELLVDIGIAHLGGRLAHLGGRSARFADLGTGSGAIAIAIAASCSNATALASDTSPKALVIAARNAAVHKLDARIKFLPGSWFAPFAGHERFDLIVSNPPYIATGEIETLDVAVRQFDPLEALDGGPNGLAAYGPIISGSARRLVPDGVLALEVGVGQAGSVAQLLEKAHFSKIEIHPDLAGHPRVLSARLTAPLAPR
ncbi:MAG: peptide chain release factor N(5)-glutamine methyltransferase [Alphaproteobacteria bacterium]|nr:peptide chain release factor N(5)-glutamine methyltransferase [Alphaproteobacteria bacterium]